MHVSTNVKYLLRKQGARMVAYIRIEQKYHLTYNKWIRKETFGVLVHGILIYRYDCYDFVLKTMEINTKYLSISIQYTGLIFNLLIHTALIYRCK